MSTGGAAAVQGGCRPSQPAASERARTRRASRRLYPLWVTLLLLLSAAPCCLSSRRGGHDLHSPVVPPRDGEHERQRTTDNSRRPFGIFRRRPREQAVEADEGRSGGWGRELPPPSRYHPHHREADEALEREQERRRREHYRCYGGRMVNVASAQASMMEPKQPQQQQQQQQQEEEGEEGEDWTFSRFRAQIRKEVEEESRRQEQQEEERRRKLRAGYLQPPPNSPSSGSSSSEPDKEEAGAGAAAVSGSKRQQPQQQPKQPKQEEEEEQLPMTAEERKGAAQALIHMKVHHQLHNQAMLYVACTVNDKSVRACVDTGASTTVMSLKMARECGLMPHVDRSVVGGVKGVGFAKILGCVHDARIRLGRMEVRTRVSIIDCLSPPFVIGLDVLRHCKCDVSFRENVLVLRNEDGQQEVLPLYHGHHHDADDSSSSSSSSPPSRQPTAPSLPEPTPAAAAAAAKRPPTDGGAARGASSTGAATRSAVELDEEEDEEEDGGGPGMGGVSMAGV